MLATLHTIVALGPNWMDPNWLLDRYGQDLLWVALAIIFAECGLLFPILPGDSLLFSIGLFINRAEAGEAGIDVNIVLACALLSLAAFAGNVSGYEIGRALGHSLFDRDTRLLKRKHLDQTHEFFERHGGRALILGRFVPIVRTYVTVIAGVGTMERRHFLVWSFVGAVLWATGLTLIGYALGGIQFLQDHLEAAILVIVAVSVLPMLYEFLKHRREIVDTVDEIEDELSGDDSSSGGH